MPPPDDGIGEFVLVTRLTEAWGRWGAADHCAAPIR